MSWLKNINDFDKIQQIIFVSKNAVRYFFAGLKAKQLKLPNNITITCIGPGTAEELAKHKVKVHHIPKVNNSEHLLELPNLRDILNQNILLVKGVGGRNTINHELLERGANLTIANVYERTLPNVDPDLINAIWQADSIDIIIYTSRQAMLNTLELFPLSAKPWLFAKPCVVISQRLVKHANELGFKKITQAPYTDIIKALEGYQL